MKKTPLILVTLLDLILMGSPLHAKPMLQEAIPKDLVEFTCNEFRDNANKCQPYTCQAPFVLEPTVKTQWKIIKTMNNRCLISDTTDDMGLKNNAGDPLPVTRTCEYNETGIEIISSMLDEIQAGYYYPPVDTPDDGSYGCTFTSNGASIKPPPYEVYNEDQS